MANNSPYGNFKILITKNVIIVETPLWITHLFLPAFFLAGLIYIFTIADISPYIFALILLAIALLHKVWVLYKPINVISIEVQNKRFLVRSRNLLQRLIDKEMQLEFTEVHSFTIKEGPEFFYDPTRYIIVAITKDGREVPFTHTSDSKVAETLKELFEHRKINKENNQ